MAVKQSVYYSNDYIRIIVGILYAYWNLYSKIVLALLKNKVTTDTMIKVLVAVGIPSCSKAYQHKEGSICRQYAWDKVYKVSFKIS